MYGWYIEECIFSTWWQNWDKFKTFLWQMHVVYFEQLSGAVRTQKLVKILFWTVCNLFLHFKHLSVIFGRNQEKTFKNVRKNCVFSNSLKLVHMQMLVDSLRRYFEVVFFLLIFYFLKHFQVFSWFQPKNHWKTLEMNKKG